MVFKSIFGFLIPYEDLYFLVALSILLWPLWHLYIRQITTTHSFRNVYPSLVFSNTISGDELHGLFKLIRVRVIDTSIYGIIQIFYVALVGRVSYWTEDPISTLGVALLALLIGC